MPLTFPVVNIVSFTSLDQQLLRFSPLDHVMEMTCHLFKMVQFDFEEGNLRSGLIELLLSFAITTYDQTVLLKLISLDRYMFYRKL